MNSESSIKSNDGLYYVLAGVVAAWQLIWTLYLLTITH